MGLGGSACNGAIRRTCEVHHALPLRLPLPTSKSERRSASQAARAAVGGVADVGIGDVGNSVVDVPAVGSDARGTDAKGTVHRGPPDSTVVAAGSNAGGNATGTLVMNGSEPVASANGGCSRGGSARRRKPRKASASS